MVISIFVTCGVTPTDPDTSDRLTCDYADVMSVLDE
jgi:hypothetical protein